MKLGCLDHLQTKRNDFEKKKFIVNLGEIRRIPIVHLTISHKALLSMFHCKTLSYSIMFLLARHKNRIERCLTTLPLSVLQLYCAHMTSSVAHNSLHGSTKDSPPPPLASKAFSRLATNSFCLSLRRRSDFLQSVLSFELCKRDKTT